MSVGYSVDKSALDGIAGSTVQSLRDLLDQVNRVKVWLDATSDATLTGLGYSAGEITTLRAAFTDLDNLRKVARGQQAQTPASDFFFNASKLLGVR